MKSSPLKLDLQLVIESGPSYTLTGAARSANVNIGLNDLLIYAYDIRRGIPSGLLKFNAGQVLRITRARMLPNVPGLQPGDDLAANIDIIQGKANGTGIDIASGTQGCPLKFMRFNEWEEKDLEIRFVDDESSLGIGYAGTLCLSDFNVQDDWVGQEVNFIIEAEAELYIGN